MIMYISIYTVVLYTYKHCSDDMCKGVPQSLPTSAAALELMPAVLYLPLRRRFSGWKHPPSAAATLRPPRVRGGLPLPTAALLRGGL